MRSDVAMSEMIRVRVFKDEKRSLERIAKDKGMSVSELIRASTLSELTSQAGMQ